MGNHWAFSAFCVLALAACPTVDLGDTPSDIGSCNPAKGIAFFKSDIETKYLALTDPTNSCAKSTMCHQGHAPFFDVTPPLDDDANYKAAQAQLNCGQPTASPLLTRPLAGIDGHGGGDIFPNTNDPRVQTFLMWFQ